MGQWVEGKVLTLKEVEAMGNKTMLILHGLHLSMMEELLLPITSLSRRRRIWDNGLKERFLH